MIEFSLLSKAFSIVLFIYFDYFEAVLLQFRSAPLEVVSLQKAHNRRVLVDQTPSPHSSLAWPVQLRNETVN